MAMIKRDKLYIMFTYQIKIEYLRQLCWMANTKKWSSIQEIIKKSLLNL